MKLTAEQQAAVDNLKNEFNKLNATSTVSGGLIGISEIMDTEKSRRQRLNEIKLIQQSHDQARQAQIEQDIEKLRPEIEALGLKVEKYYSEYIKIFDPNGSNSYNWILIKYRYKYKSAYYNEYAAYDSEKTVLVYHNVELVRGDDDKYGGFDSFDNIEEFVMYDKFRQDLAFRHREALRNKK